MTAVRAGHAVRQALLRSGERRLLTDATGNSRTGHALAMRVDRLAGMLLDRGLAHRRVGLWFWNSLAAIEAFLAVEWIGGTRVPVDPGAAPEEARAVFTAAQVDAVLCDPEHAGSSAGALVHDDGTELAGPPVWPDLSVEGSQTLVLYPRSVVEGQLLGVPISYANWAAIMELNLRLYREGSYGPPIAEDDCYLTAQQLMHGTSLVGTFPFLMMGLPQAVARRFEASELLPLIARERVTTALMVPGMVTRLTEAAERQQSVALPLRRILYGGGVLPTAEMKQAMRVLGAEMVQLYGRLEGGWPLSVLGAAEHRAIAGGDERLARSCGRPIPETGIRLRPLAGREPGEGELWVKNRMVSEAYADAEGWCSLGDIMWQDEHGYLYYRGRLDRMINTGYHVYPEEIEEALRQVPGIAGARVVGEPTGAGSEKLVAFIVPEPGADPAALQGSALSWLGSRLARYKLPREWRVVDRLP
ncbi:MAG: class I adenylate-forming enzyme family protein [Hyalangium sp.]|uniref:class I adenylate-forming enzyme family protein n=1 Tax=Hyalangium sp. TaxID=2028555 RepID=UPI003899C4DC